MVVILNTKIWKYHGGIDSKMIWNSDGKPIKMILMMGLWYCWVNKLNFDSMQGT